MLMPVIIFNRIGSAMRHLVNHNTNAEQFSFVGANDGGDRHLSASPGVYSRNLCQII